MNSGLDVSQTAPWRALQAHSKQMAALHIRDLFSADENRGTRYSRFNHPLLFDFSKNKINNDTLGLLLALAQELDLQERSRALLAANPTSCHVSARDNFAKPLSKPSADVADAKSRMRVISDAVRAGYKTGHSGKRIRHVINLGIGGSCLGPVMMSRALVHLGHPDIDLHYVAHIDQAQMNSVLAKIEPESSLFIAVSRSFTTHETLVNIQRARQWLTAHYGSKTAWLDHFIAVTNQPARAEALGFTAEQCVAMPDRLGGRYSLWSATGLLLAIYIGMEQFEQFLAGAHQADQHFFSQPLANNIPMLHALLSVWDINFQNVHTRVILPYNHVLTGLVLHLQQLEMESNGKSVDHYGRAIAYQTSPVVWGGSGIEAQHAFYQMLYQGMLTVASDFIVALRGGHGQHNDQLIFSDYIAQTHSLMWGCPDANPHKLHRGDQPGNAILLSTISPQSLGMLIAFYEHKVYVQSLIWQINAFDQWGVELGKSIAGDVLPSLATGEPLHRPSMRSDSSSQSLIKQYKRSQKNEKFA